MNFERYVADRISRDPRFETEMLAARAELEFAAEIAEQRRIRKMTLETLSSETGIPITRLEALEEGDSATLNEILWLSHVFDLVVSVNPDLRLETQARPRVSFSTTTNVTSAATPKISPSWSHPETSAQHMVADCASAR